MMKAVVVERAVEVETAMRGTLESEEVAETEKTAKGVVVARPSLPSTLLKVEVAVPVPRYREPWFMERAREVVGARDWIP
jgi:hypothetical protein